MKTYRIIILPRAAADLKEIHDYIAKDSPQNAAGMIARILDAPEPLKQFPHRTVVLHQSRKLRHPVRSLSVRPYTIYFRVLEDIQAVRVLHVRHGARQQPRW